MPRWLYIVLVLGTLAFNPASPLLQAGVQVEDVAAFYTYGQEVTFQARISPAAQVQSVSLFIQPDDQSARIEPVTLGNDGAVIHRFDLSQAPFRSFSTVTYWFRLTLNTGAEYTSNTYTFDYTDNRFDWQTLSDDRFVVYWYDRPLSFGQDILNAAQSGLKSAQSVLPASPAAPLRIYVYATAQDFQHAIYAGGQSWAAGQASPEHGLILVSIPTGAEERLELERQIPHEMVHVLQYELVGEQYTRVPVWFLEGAASLAELYPNPDYQSVLLKAARNGALLPLDQLCGDFPREASGAFLAYAQSASFTRFLLQNYGATSLAALLEDYQDGIGCLEAPQRVFGRSFAQLETRWRQETLGIDVAGLAFRNLSPYLALLALLLLIPLLVAFRTRVK